MAFGVSVDNSMNSITVDHQLDTSGLRCPLPLLKAKLLLKQIACGETVKIIATDSGTVRDLVTFITRSDHEMLESFTDHSPYIYIIRKG